MIKENTRYKKIIECPHCKYQYEPSDIFLPNYILGKKYLEKSKEGKLSLVQKYPQVLEESYICDSCDKNFKVYAKLEFMTVGNEIENILSEHNLKVNLDV